MSEPASVREVERGHPNSSHIIYGCSMIYVFPWRLLYLVEFVFALMATRLLLTRCSGFPFGVDRGFIRFGFCYIPFALNLCAALAFGFFLAH